MQLIIKEKRLYSKIIFCLFLLYLVTLQFSFAQNENTFYVSPGGDDSNNGSIQSPFKSISYGVEQLSPGDTLCIREGVYSESVYITNSGIEDNYLNIFNYPGENPIIDGSQIDGNGLLVSSSYLNFSGLYIRNWSENGFWIEASHNIEIRNCTVESVQFGIGFADGSHDFKIIDCIIRDFVLYGFDASASGGADCYNGLIENCKAYSGSDPSQNVDGFALGHGDQSGFLFIDCVAYDVYDGFDISADDTMLVGCLAFICSNSGFKIWGDNVTLLNCIGYDSNTNLELDWSGTPKTVSVIHSNLVKSSTFNIWVENQRDKLNVYNSIIACGDNIGICFEDGYSNSYSGDYNAFHNWNQERFVSFAYEQEYSYQDFINKEWSDQTGQDIHSLIIDNPNALFVDLDNLDLHPIPGSPIIDSADNSHSIGFDFDYQPRPNGEKSDIGAFEYYQNRNISRITNFEIPNSFNDTQDETPSDITQVLSLVGLSLLLIIGLIYFYRTKLL